MPFPELHPSLLRALAARNYTEPTPVQQAVLRPEATGRDLLVSAQTGSGKTVAYGLSLVETLLGAEPRFARPKQPLALVVAPTRELALQVHRELAWLLGEAGGRVLSCVGGMDIRREQRALAAGAHIVVGTPGRLADHLDQEHLDLSEIRAVVLDEADEMLDFGFREELELLLSATPPERRTMMFSATLPKAILGLARLYQRDALRMALSRENEPHADIEYRAYRIAPRDTEHAVVNALRYIDAPGALVFCSTREAVRHLHANLRERGFSAVALSGELEQHERTTALQALRDGRARVLRGNDVARSWIGHAGLRLVIHADLPQNETGAVPSRRTHRARRTQRPVGDDRPRAESRSRRAPAGLDQGQYLLEHCASADAIRARDEENLVREILAMAEAPAEEDLAAARALLGGVAPNNWPPFWFAFAAKFYRPPKCCSIPAPSRRKRPSKRRNFRPEKNPLPPSAPGSTAAKNKAAARRRSRRKNAIKRFAKSYLFSSDSQSPVPCRRPRPERRLRVPAAKRVFCGANLGSRAHQPSHRLLRSGHLQQPWFQQTVPARDLSFSDSAPPIRPATAPNLRSSINAIGGYEDAASRAEIRCKFLRGRGFGSPAFADDPTPPMPPTVGPGSLNYVEGQVSVNTRLSTRRRCPLRSCIQTTRSLRNKAKLSCC